MKVRAPPLLGHLLLQSPFPTPLARPFDLVMRHRPLSTETHSERPITAGGGQAGGGQALVVIKF